MSQLHAEQRRTVLWLALSALAFPLLGAGSLVIVAAGASMIGIWGAEREFVVASQITIWAMAMGAFVVLLGKLLGAASSVPTPSFALATAGVLAAVAIAFAAVLETRAGGILDFDEIGPVIVMPPLLLAATSGVLGTASAMTWARRPWALATILCAAAAFAAGVLSWSNPSLLTSALVGGGIVWAMGAAYVSVTWLRAAAQPT